MILALRPRVKEDRSPWQPVGGEGRRSGDPWGRDDGCLIGDAMGAPVEGKTYKQIDEAYGKEGVRDFEGVGTDDTAIREQLVGAILASDGHPTVDHFARTFIESRSKNYRLWYIPVKNAFHKYESKLALAAYAGWGNMLS